MTSQIYEPEVLVTAPQPSPALASRAAQRIPGLRAESASPTLVGMAVVIAGFVLLGIAWGQIARQTDVAEQMPYLVSGGIVGLGLIQVGLTIVNVAAKRRDAALRERDTRMLAEALAEFRSELSDDDIR